MKKIILISIFVLALFLRIYRLAVYPCGFNADEAALGYNAYSLLKTGRDEFGHPWPINFQSFNDWKPGFYVYLTMPFIKVFGLNEWAVRLPSAILGGLTVIIVYLLVKKMFNDESCFFPAVAAFLLTISPWHLHFSRGAWETNAATFFMTLGIFLFFLALKKPKYYFFSVLSFLLSMFTYHSARVVVPLLGLGIFIFYWKKIFIKENFHLLIPSFILGVFSLGVLFFSMNGQAGISRFSGVGIFADQGPFWRVNEMRGQHVNPYSLWSKILHNKILEYSLQFFDNYLRHFEGNFLFISGDEIQRNRVPEMGQMYLIEVPFLILGIYFLLRKKPKNYPLVFWWLAVAPVASAMTFQSPHAIRALNMVIPLVIIVSYGIVNCAIFLKSKFFAFSKIPDSNPKIQSSWFKVHCSWFKIHCSWFKVHSSLFKVLLSLLAILYFWNFSFYLHQYYVHYPQTYPYAWEAGFKDLAAYVKANESRFEKIYITNRYDQPYILMAFFTQYPPQNLQQEATLTPRDQYGFSTVAHFGKYYFGPIDMERLTGEKNIMIVGAPKEIPDSATIVKRIYFMDGKTEAFRIVEP